MIEVMLDLYVGRTIWPPALIAFLCLVGVSAGVLLMKQFVSLLEADERHWESKREAISAEQEYLRLVEAEREKQSE